MYLISFLNDGRSSSKLKDESSYVISNTVFNCLFWLASSENTKVLSEVVTWTDGGSNWCMYKRTNCLTQNISKIAQIELFGKQVELNSEQ